MKTLVRAILMVLNFGTFAIAGFLSFAMAHGAGAGYAWLIPAAFAGLSLLGMALINSSRFGTRIRT